MHFENNGFEAYPSHVEQKHKVGLIYSCAAHAIAWKNPYKVLLRAEVLGPIRRYRQEHATIFKRFEDVGIPLDNLWRKRYSVRIKFFSKRRIRLHLSAGLIRNLKLMRPTTYRKRRSALEKYNDAERNIANKLEYLMRVRTCTDYSPCAFLDETQNEAIRLACTSSVFILCGGAGVGKSRTLVQIVEQLGERTNACLCTHW